MSILWLKILCLVLNTVEASPLRDYYGINRWNLSPSNTNLNYYIDSSASAYSSVIQQSFNDWSSIPTVYVTFTQVASSASANIIIGVASSLSISGAGGVANGTSDSDGNLQSCTVSVSSASANASTAKVVFLHEIGHCLGLAHSVANGAVMSYWSNPSSIPIDDDKYALTLLYPRGSSAGYPMGCATTRSSKPSGKRGLDQQKKAVSEICFLLGVVLLGFFGVRNFKDPRRFEF